MIEGLWKPERMQIGQGARQDRLDADAGDQERHDPSRGPSRPRRRRRRTTDNAAPVGKIFFDSPEGRMVCSGTVVTDLNHPGKSDLVLDRGPPRARGARGGWYRNITFVPAYNDLGRVAGELQQRAAARDRPYGQYWADWAATSAESISEAVRSGLAVRLRRDARASRRGA